MAVSPIRAASIYSRGRKVATVQTGTLKTSANGDREVGDGGELLGRTSGAIFNDLSCDTILLYSGNTSSQEWATALEAGTTLKIQIGIVDGKIEEGEFFVTGRDVSWDHKTGKMTGAFTFEAGALTRT